MQHILMILMTSVCIKDGFADIKHGSYVYCTCGTNSTTKNRPFLFQSTQIYTNPGLYFANSEGGMSSSSKEPWPLSTNRLAGTNQKFLSR